MPHGLNIHFEKDGTAVLYHANNDATVHKTTLDGQILWTQKWSPQMGNYKPTDAVAPPDGERVVTAVEKALAARQAARSGGEEKQDATSE